MVEHTELRSKQVYIFEIPKYLLSNRLQFLDALFLVVARYP